MGTVVTGDRAGDRRTEGCVKSEAFRQVNDELVKYVRLKELLSADEPDTRAVLDTLEGETDLLEALAEVAKSAREDEAMASGVGLYITELQQRKSRMEKTADHKRTLIIMAMEKAGLNTVKQAACTLSLSATAPKVVVKDEAQIPSRFWKPADPTLDKAALKEALDAGEEIQGAELSNGGIKLTMRIK